MVLDIGGGNTKGGYVEVYNEGNEIFFPLYIRWGTVTLTEKINKKNAKLKIPEYNDQQISMGYVLKEEIQEMYKTREMAQFKKNIYLSGGAVWAFYTLFYNKQASEVQNYEPITFTNALMYSDMLQNEFEKFEEIGKTNPEVARVLQTYSQKHLISGNNILLTALENIRNIDKKKLYYAKQGQIAWLISYVVDSSSGQKPIY